MTTQKENNNHEIFNKLNQIEITNVSLSNAEIKRYWKKIVKEVKEKKRLELFNFYLHIPFCRQKCFECNYFSMPLSDTSQLDKYIDYIEDNIKFYSKIFRGIKFTNLYIGGGTPSILTLKQLKRVFSLIFKNFDFYEYGQKSFEFNPDSIDEEKIILIKEFEFNRTSFGVQSMSGRLLELHNRGYQDPNKIKIIVDLLNKHGLKDINVDIMFGMKGQSVKDVIESLEHLIKIKLPFITLYRMNYSRANAEIEKKLDIFSGKLYPRIKKSAILYNYKIILDTTHCKLLKDNDYYSLEPITSKCRKELIRFAAYSDIPNYPFSLFSIGPKSRSHIFGHLSYSFSEEDITHNQKIILFNDRKKVADGKIIGFEYEIIRYIANSLTNNPYFSLNELNDLYCIDFKNKFKKILLLMKNKYKIVEGVLHLKGKDNNSKIEFLQEFIRQENKAKI